jgi:tRNA1Val (adenine37-N6)-methyltransferase
VTLFRFKQFAVDDSAAAMKTGTDSVLLGAWAPVPEKGTVVDIGCGSGIISLMIAQRTKSNIVGLEIDGDAAAQAVVNVAKSPWPDQITIVHNSFQEYVAVSAKQFDLVVSNPPWFEKDLASPNQQRSVARKGVSFSFLQLIQGAWKLLLYDGVLAVIIPEKSLPQFHFYATAEGFMLEKKTLVKDRRYVLPKRVLLAYRNSFPGKAIKDTIVLKCDDGSIHPSVQLLTKDFYL